MDWEKMREAYAMIFIILFFLGGGERNQQFHDKDSSYEITCLQNFFYNLFSILG